MTSSRPSSATTPAGLRGAARPRHRPEQPRPEGLSGARRWPFSASRRARSTLLLAQPGIDVNALNAAGETALMLAAIAGRPGAAASDCSSVARRSSSRAGRRSTTPPAGPTRDRASCCSTRGATLDADAPNGTTPLMLAAADAPESSVDLLLARGADTRRRNQRGLCRRWTSPSWAAATGWSSVSNRCRAEFCVHSSRREGRVRFLPTRRMATRRLPRPGARPRVQLIPVPLAGGSRCTPHSPSPIRSRSC